MRAVYLRMWKTHFAAVATGACSVRLLSPLTWPGLKIAVLFVLQPHTELEPLSRVLLSSMLNEA